MSQISLFDLLNGPYEPAQPPASAPSLEPSTACGIAMPAYYHKLGCGYSAAGAKLSCTHNRDNGTVTCSSCLEAMQ